jgi:predicted phosphodiesterase
MRCAILADIHSNATALMAVLEDVDRRGGVDELWCLGDIVGYGPDPHRCIEILRQFKCVGVAGNHDLAAIEKTGLSSFDPDAAQAIRWTMRQISTEDALFLTRLETMIQRDTFTLVHGSPRQGELPLFYHALLPGGTYAHSHGLQKRCRRHQRHSPL